MYLQRVCKQYVRHAAYGLLSMSKTILQHCRHPVVFLACGFGSGASPVAPGTAGTLVAIPIYLAMSQLAMFWYLLVTAVMFLIGIYLCDRAAAHFGQHDHGAIVWDEIVGFLVTMSPVTMSMALADWRWIVAGFIAFRFFDILKPWPISWLDRHVGGGLGIMLDDVAAGLAGLAVLLIVQNLLV